jgi:hypothetical protein
MDALSTLFSEKLPSGLLSVWSRKGYVSRVGSDSFQGLVHCHDFSVFRQGCMVIPLFTSFLVLITEHNLTLGNVT